MKTIGTQQRWLDAAEAELIATDGHLEMEAAARRADARIGLAYAQFGSKSGLMAAVIDRYFEPIREIVIGEAIPLKIDWRLREKTRLAAIVDYVYDHPLSRLVAGRLSKCPEVVDIQRATMDSFMELGARNIIQGQDQGVVKADVSPSMTIPIILGGIRIAIENAIVNDFRPDRDDLVEHIWQLVSGALQLDQAEIGGDEDRVAVDQALTSEPSRCPHTKPHLTLVAEADPEAIEIEGDFEALVRDGYVIIENIISPALCSEIKAAGQALLQDSGRNGFEAISTQRVYNILSKTRATDILATHSRILGLLDQLFRPGYLLSQSQIINVLPGAGSQELITGDGFYGLPRPRQPLAASAIWAIDAFTEENGATEIIPGSHEWDDTRIGELKDAIPVTMSAGSVLICLGTTWYGEGRNRSDRGRCAITHEYCEAYMRQQENYFLELSKDTVRDLSPKLQALIGYSIYPPLMGMVDGKHPLQALEE